MVQSDKQAAAAWMPFLDLFSLTYSFHASFASSFELFLKRGDSSFRFIPILMPLYVSCDSESNGGNHFVIGRGEPIEKSISIFNVFPMRSHHYEKIL